MPSKVTVTVVLTKEERNKLQQIAEADDRSLSYVAGKFIREGIEKLENKASADEESAA